MARQITAYGCDFKCGRNSLTSKPAMERHEKNCFRNPAKNACMSCAHFNSYMDSNGMELEPQNLHTFRVNECYQELDIQDKLKFNCEKHKVKLIKKGD
jgi:hypothetical protein